VAKEAIFFSVSGNGKHSGHHPAAAHTYKLTIWVFSAFSPLSFSRSSTRRSTSAATGNLTDKIATSPYNDETEEDEPDTVEGGHAATNVVAGLKGFARGMFLGCLDVLLTKRFCYYFFEVLTY